jgi:hypothetical protein
MLLSLKNLLQHLPELKAQKHNFTLDPEVAEIKQTVSKIKVRRRKDLKTAFVLTLIDTDSEFNPSIALLLCLF